MLGAIQGFFALKWSQSPLYHPLPPNITRSSVSTAAGDLELLISEPERSKQSATRRNPPVFFVHGGEGSGAVWLEWMQHLATTYDATTYAYSLRCHGASYSVPFWRMTWQTSLDDLASDLATCIREVREREGQDPVVVAHSSGGGLSQYALSKGLFQARALVLVGAVPHWGNMGVYLNWFKRIDPWFSIRSLFHLYHPNSPLSTPRLVYNAFFGPEYPFSKVPEFMRWMSNYEAMFWPFGMAGRGWGIHSRTWLAPCDILRNITHWEGSSQKVMIMIGTEDKMMGGTQARMVQEYSLGITRLADKDKLESAPTLSEPPNIVQVDARVSEQNHGRVRLAEVHNAGHHTQNDVQWKEAAESLRRFLEQV